MASADKPRVEPTVPLDYKPYDTVELCSNTLMNVPRWFQVKSEIPILVGEGAAGPRLWLRGLVDHPDDWREIVRDNVVTLREIPGSGHVTVVDSNVGSLDVDIGGSPVLRCFASQADNKSKLTVSLLDLYPIHLGIRGNLSGLSVGSMRASGNTFRNVGAAFGA